MGKYIIADDPVVEKDIEEIFRLITDEIVMRFQPKSIILSGSFGRGEGAVIVNGGELKFLSDCEISVVTPKHIGKDLKKLASELSKETGMEIGLWSISPGKFDSYRVRKPSITNYEWKYGSRILYGENYLEKIPDFKPEDIPLWEGIRLIFNRMAESLKYFSINYMHSEPSEEEKRKLLYWIYKIVLACQDALLLSLGKYQYSYKVRNEIFQEVFPTKLESLYREIPELLSLASKATSYKLYGGIEREDIVESWFYVMRLCDRVFRHVIERDMGFTFDSYIGFQQKYMKHPNIVKRYYCRLSGNPLYQNAVSTAKLLECGKFPIKILRKAWTPWIHLMFSTVPLVYFSLSENWEVNEHMLKEACNVLKLISHPVVVSVHNDPLFTWDETRQSIYDVWKIIVD